MHKNKIGDAVKMPTALFLSVASSIIFTLFFFPVGAHSKNPQDEYKQIQKDLQTQRKKLESANRMERSVLEELRKTTSELNNIEEQLSAQRKKTKKIQAAIIAVQEDIEANKKGIQTQADYLKKRLRALQRLHKSNDALLVIISGLDEAKTLRITKYFNDISRHDRKIIEKYQETVRVLDDKQEKLKRLSSELKSEEKKLSAMEESLKHKKAERETLLVSVRKEKKSYQQMIRELQESSQKLLRIIQDSEQHEKETKKKRTKKVKPGVKEEEPEDDSTFGRLKGRLPWPANGTVAIQYGTQMDPLFNLPVFRSGIHIKAAHGSTVKAVAEGKVVFAEEFKGYGQLVIISHGGNYHTLYGNLARIFSSKGAIIKENETLGSVGESTTLGTSGLYFELRYKGKPLDPRQWLKR
ncbi:MAG: peptidoglycan DD-metalloendopeptidase family protein [Nitrospirae bacterium]|nr:peptidoglycan DD-metalloendopeptidase family protein [Nitrospirota bacterium]